MLRTIVGLFLLLSCWHHIQPTSTSKMVGSYATNKVNSGHVRQNNMFGIFGGFVPCERGTCTSKQYCDQSGGESIGYCSEPHMSSRGVCCSFRESCGQTTSDNVALFRNPNYPNMNWEPVNCAFTMVPREDVCGIRVEFIEAILSAAVRNACPRDSVTILQYSQSTDSYNVPFCGLIQGVSTVVEVRGTTKLQIVVTAQSPYALWNIRLAQINCSSVHIPVVEACGIANAMYPNVNSKDNTLSSTPKSNLTTTFPMFRAKQKYTSTNIWTKGTSTGRIIGGTESPNVFPWVVALMKDYGLQCGGSLIAREWVLTAGHCLALYQNPTVPDIVRFTVVLGVHNLNSVQDVKQVARHLSRIVRHPQYLGDQNDIALLRLIQPVSYSVVIRPICLPRAPDDTYDGRYGVISGWGLTGNGTVVTDVLLSATVQILDNALCNQLWGISGQQIHDSQLCTGLGNAATCGGDSGGPLAVQEQQDGFYSVVGIISFGSREGCSTKMLPDVLTRVTYYLNWIYLVLTEA